MGLGVLTQDDDWLKIPIQMVIYALNGEPVYIHPPGTSKILQLALS